MATPSTRGDAMPKKMCKLCHNLPATVPDRNCVNRRKTICRACHAKRLLGDLDYCIALENERRAKYTEGEQEKRDA